MYTVLCDTVFCCLFAAVDVASASKLTWPGIISVFLLDADAATPMCGLQLSQVVCKVDMCMMLDSSTYLLPLKIAVQRTISTFKRT
jgi:hypothetical protein